MARKKSSLDMDAPVIVEGEEITENTPVIEETGKAEEKPAMTEKKIVETKTEEQKTNKKRGVKICAI